MSSLEIDRVRSRSLEDVHSDRPVLGPIEICMMRRRFDVETDNPGFIRHFESEPALDIDPTSINDLHSLIAIRLLSDSFFEIEEDPVEKNDMVLDHRAPDLIRYEDFFMNIAIEQLNDGLFEIMMEDEPMLNGTEKHFPEEQSNNDLFAIAIAQLNEGLFEIP